MVCIADCVYVDESIYWWKCNAPTLVKSECAQFVLSASKSAVFQCVSNLLYHMLHVPNVYSVVQTISEIASDWMYSITEQAGLASPSSV